jgi:hypothetical protein
MPSVPPSAQLRHRHRRLLHALLQGLLLSQHARVHHGHSLVVAAARLGLPRLVGCAALLGLQRLVPAAALLGLLRLVGCALLAAALLGLPRLVGCAASAQRMPKTQLHGPYTSYKRIALAPGFVEPLCRIASMPHARSPATHGFSLSLSRKHLLQGNGERQRQVPEVTPRAPAARLASPRLAPWPRCPLLRRAKHVSRLTMGRRDPLRSAPPPRAGPEPRPQHGA